MTNIVRMLPCLLVLFCFLHLLSTQVWINWTTNKKASMSRTHAGFPTWCSICWTERLVDIKNTNDNNKDVQAQAIITSLDRNRLDKDGIALQSYDYTSFMSGEIRGCQAWMKSHLDRDIPYIPCTAHRINATVEHGCKTSKTVCSLLRIYCNSSSFSSHPVQRASTFTERRWNSQTKNCWCCPIFR